LNQTTEYFQGKFTDADLNPLRASSEIEAIEEDGIATITGVQFNEFFVVFFYVLMIDLVRTDAPWGLNRISTQSPLTDQDPSHLTFTYTYDDYPGSGIDIYVIGTHFRNMPICNLK
jgi:cerevisin